MKTTNNYLIYIQDALGAFGLSDKTRKYGGDHSGYDTRMLYEIQDTIESLPPAQYALTCDGCSHVGIYDTDFPCNVCVRRAKDYYEQE